MSMYLYAIGSPNGPIKIGVSSNPLKRHVQIQTACPFPVSLIHTELSRSKDEAFADERFLHDFLTDKHAHGEWFMISAQEAIEHVRDAVGYGNHFRDRENAA